MTPSGPPLCLDFCPIVDHRGRTEARLRLSGEDDCCLLSSSQLTRGLTHERSVFLRAGNVVLRHRNRLRPRDRRLRTLGETATPLGAVVTAATTIAPRHRLLELRTTARHSWTE